MRNIPDEFLGALFGAWIGITTEIWNKPFWLVGLFTLTIIILALALDVAAGPFKDSTRVNAGLILLLLGITSGVVFTFAPGFEVFDDSKQLVFFWLLLAGWLVVGVVSIFLTQRLSPAEPHQSEGG